VCAHRLVAIYVVISVLGWKGPPRQNDIISFQGLSHVEMRQLWVITCLSSGICGYSLWHWLQATNAQALDASIQWHTWGFEGGMNHFNKTLRFSRFTFYVSCNAVFDDEIPKRRPRARLRDVSDLQRTQRSVGHDAEACGRARQAAQRAFHGERLYGALQA